MLKKENKKGKIHKVFNIFGIRFKFFVGFESSLYINKYLQNIKPYKSSSHKIWDVEPKNRDQILKLDWNEATIPPSPLVQERLQKLLEDKNFLNLYPMTQNKKILNLLSEYTGLNESNLQYFASSDSLHEYIAKMYIKENDKVLIQGPSYDNFRLTAQANGADIYYSEVNEDFKFNPEKFYNDLKIFNPTFVYICSPNNPCGYINSKPYIEKLLKEFVGTMFLIDEAYFEFCKESVQDLVLKYENILVSRTMSKAFALANLRFGYLISSKNNISNIANIRNPKNINSFTQEAAIAVLEDIPYMENYVNEVNIAKKFFYEEISKFSGITAYPSKANFILLKFSNYKLKTDLYNYLQKNDIFVRNLQQSRLLYKCLRITIGNLSQMQRVIQTISEFFNTLPDKNCDNSKIAFFDFCETLVNFQTGDTFVYYLANNCNSLKVKFKRYFIDKKIKMFKVFNKNYNFKKDVLSILKGLDRKLMDEYALNYYIEKIKPNFIPEIITELQRKKNEGYNIFVVSGGYDIYLKYFVEEFNLNGLFSTKIKFNNNICLGEIDGLDCMNENKVCLIKDFFGEDTLNNAETIAYSDSSSDLPILKLCKNRVVVTNKAQKWVEEINAKVINWKK